MAMADLEKMGASLIKVDVTSDEDVKKAVDHIISEKGRIDVVMIHPGAVKTEFDNVAIKTMDGIDYPEDYKPLMKGFRNYMVDSYKNCPGPESTVKAMVAAGTAKRPKGTYDTTSQARIMKRLTKWLSNSFIDKMVLSMYNRSATA